MTFLLRQRARFLAVSPLRLVAAVVAAALVGAPAAAWPGSATVGVKGGFTSATFSLDPSGIVDYSNREGWSGGLFAVYPFTRGVAVQVEAMYLMRGASFGKSQATDVDGNPLGEFETFHVRDDLGWSFLARVTPPRATRVAPYLLFGTAVMQELKERIKNTGYVETEMKVDDLKNTDVALELGGGADTALGPSQILLEVRYDYGLSNLSRLAGVELHTSTLRVMTGYSF
jgi:opacity protein-like surface antigen